MKMIYNNALAPAEYYKRIVQNIEGGTGIINDKAGTHLEYRPIQFEDFLTQQLVQRIRLKFATSDYTICQNKQEEMLKVCAYTLKAYDFSAYSMVVLYDLLTETSLTKTKNSIEGIKEF